MGLSTYVFSSYFVSPSLRVPFFIFKSSKLFLPFFAPSKYSEINTFEEKLFTVKKSQSIILINWSVGSQTHQIQDSLAHKSSSLHQIITIILELLMVLCIIDYMSHQHYRAFDHVNSHWCHYILIHWLDNENIKNQLHGGNNILEWDKKWIHPTL